MCWVVGCLIGIKCKFVYVGFGIVLYAAVMLLRFTAAKILPNPKLEKERKFFFIRGLSKQYDFASHKFLVV